MGTGIEAPRCHVTGVPHNHLLITRTNSTDLRNSLCSSTQTAQRHWFKLIKICDIFSRFLGRKTTKKLLKTPIDYTFTLHNDDRSLDRQPLRLCAEAENRRLAERDHSHGRKTNTNKSHEPHKCIPLCRRANWLESFLCIHIWIYWPFVCMCLYKHVFQ